MSLNYASVSGFAQTGGLLFFVIVFGVAALYALWPRNKEKFDRAARSLLDDGAAPVNARDQERTDRGQKA